MHESHTENFKQLSRIYEEAREAADSEGSIFRGFVREDLDSGLRSIEKVLTEYLRRSDELLSHAKVEYFGGRQSGPSVN